MNRPFSEYPVVLQQDVIWGDMDAYGHVNNTVYFRYFEDARIAYLDKIGAHEVKEKFNLGPILATARSEPPSVVVVMAMGMSISIHMPIA